MSVTRWLERYLCLGSTWGLLSNSMRQPCFYTRDSPLLLRDTLKPCLQPTYLSRCFDFSMTICIKVIDDRSCVTAKKNPSTIIKEQHNPISSGPNQNINFATKKSERKTGCHCVRFIIWFQNWYRILTTRSQCKNKNKRVIVHVCS